MNFRLLAAVTMLAMPNASIATADNPVVFFLGEAQFFNRDYVKIDSVTSTGDGFEVGATITVTGTYALNSADHARLCFYTTQSMKPGAKAAASPELKSQRMDAKRGTHPFKLSKVVTGDGGPHLTFYDSDSAFGGVYFGDETNVWMKKGWSYDPPNSVPAASSNGG